MPPTSSSSPPPLNKSDPYILAHSYKAYMLAHPIGSNEQRNPYYENLLANYPEPRKERTDKMARAIRYAKMHCECYYEVRDVERILGWVGVEERRSRV